MDNDDQALYIFIIIEHYYIRFRNSSHSERCGVGKFKLTSLMYSSCVSFTRCYILRCMFRIIVRGSSPARCPYCLNRELIFRFADRNTRTNRYAWRSFWREWTWMENRFSRLSKVLLLLIYTYYYYYQIHIDVCTIIIFKLTNITLIIFY